jgi:hypothetical protein
MVPSKAMKHIVDSFQLGAARGVHPLPLSYYIQNGIASRATLWRWGNQGLRILRVGGRSYIHPSDLTAFMERESSRATRSDTSKN